VELIVLMNNYNRVFNVIQTNFKATIDVIQIFLYISDFDGSTYRESFISLFFPFSTTFSLRQIGLGKPRSIHQYHIFNVFFRQKDRC
jgi:hypothetical protein